MGMLRHGDVAQLRRRGPTALAACELAGRPDAAIGVGMDEAGATPPGE
ncbi:hypothetical protein ACFY5C_27280 [Streptomyces sp. NPDC012935]